jgi:uncharacterized membrane protein
MPRMVDGDSPAVRRKRPWGLTVAGCLVIGGLVGMPWLAGAPGNGELPDWVRFLGHFHPVVLHLPIGVFALIVCQELAAMFRRRSAGVRLMFPLGFGVVSAVVAVLAGFLLYHGHAADYAEDALARRHLWGGLAFSVAAVLTFLVKAWAVALGGNPVWDRLLLFGTVGVMGFTSHDGASITHGADYLTRYAPAPLRAWLGMEPRKSSPAPAAAAAVEELAVYPDLIAPILERRCVQCHKEGKAKGRLRMDTYEMLLKGGKEGPSIEPGSAEQSNIIVRIDLPEDDDEHMPPEGKPDLTEAELLILRWWLDSGADPTGKVAVSGLPDAVRDAVKGF